MEQNCMIHCNFKNIFIISQYLFIKNYKISIPLIYNIAGITFYLFKSNLI